MIRNRIFLLACISIAALGCSSAAQDGPDSTSDAIKAGDRADRALVTLGKAAQAENKVREDDRFSIYEVSRTDTFFVKAAKGATTLGDFVIEGAKTPSKDKNAFEKASKSATAQCGYFLFSDPSREDAKLVASFADAVTRQAESAGVTSVYRVKRKQERNAVITMDCAVAFEKDGWALIVEGVFAD